VGRVHTCTKGHEVVGYHPGIINEISACFILFNLWHITGFTKKVSYHITGQLGISIHEIQTILFENQTLWFCGQRLKFIELCGVKDCTFPSLTEWQQSFSSPLPSPHAVSGCFLEDYWKIFGREVRACKILQLMKLMPG
jgi:hypothetical protein